MMIMILIIGKLFQNNYQQDDTYGLSFISRLVVLHSTCFELQGAHHQEFTSFLYRQSLAYCVGEHVGERVNTAKDYTVCQRLPVQKRSELLMMSSLKLETCRVKDD